MTNGCDASGQQEILLVGIQSAEREHISNLLVHDGYKPSYTSYSRFSEQRISARQRLIIVDTLDHGNKLIRRVRSKLCKDSDKYLKNIPPILAIVDTCLPNKQEVFNCGAADYVSCPLIMAEFCYRVEHAIHAVDWQVDASNQQQDDFRDTDATKHWPIETEHILAIRTANYLRSMIDSKVSLAELASKMATNRNKLSRAFKRHYGITVFDWLREQRMMAAAEMLRFTSNTIQQIADKSGYPDSNNFSTAFKRTFHLSPLQYRKVQQTKNIVHRSKAT